MDVERRFDRAVEDRNLRQVLAEMRGADSADVQKAGCDAVPLALMGGTGGWDRVGGTGGTQSLVLLAKGSQREAVETRVVSTWGYVTKASLLAGVFSCFS